MEDVYNQLTSASEGEFDVGLLDDVVQTAYDPSNPQNQDANNLLIALKEEEFFWFHSASIIEAAEHPQTVFFALSILEDAISTRWQVMGTDEKEGIRSFVSNKIFEQLTFKEESSEQFQELLLHKFNHTLVAILKRDWPHNWPDFIPQLLESSYSTLPSCENTFYILRLLSEDIFEASKEELTSNRLIEMKQGLIEHFAGIFDLCSQVLNPPDPDSFDVWLARECLSALSRFLVWVPSGFIFEKNLTALLVENLLPNPACRQHALECLIEIAGITDTNRGDYDDGFRYLLTSFMQIFPTLCPLEDANGDFEAALDNMDFFENDDPETFIHLTSVFLSTFLKTHLLLLETEETQEALIQAFHVLLSLTSLTEGSSEDELFKMMVEFWQAIVKTLYMEDKKQLVNRTLDFSSSLAHGGRHGKRAGTTANNNNNNNGSSNGSTSKGAVYEVILCDVRVLMADRMLKPEEVLVVEDEVTGDIIRERSKDTEALALYGLMRELMVYLTHLNPGAMEALLLERLYGQVEGGDFSWEGLNKLCWVVGSINGVRSEHDEKMFLVTIIKDLLKLCENKHGKDNKAVIASNIMYVVGQYPRFLRAHWKFLRTVVNKLFEFMHEEHPGVKDMAVDTFLTICNRCRRKFVTPQQNDPDTPFLLHLASEVTRVVDDLEAHQIRVFYEAVGILLSDRGNRDLDREQTLRGLLSVPMEQWTSIIQTISSDESILFETNTLTMLSRFLMVMEGLCRHIGDLFSHSLADILNDLIALHKTLSEYLAQLASSNSSASRRGSRVAHPGLVRRVKQEITGLMATFLDSLTFEEISKREVLDIFVPVMLEEIGSDLELFASMPEKVDVENLALFQNMLGALTDALPYDLVLSIHQLVFSTVLPNLVEDFGDYPSLRQAFYKFLLQEIDSVFSTFLVPFFHRAPEDFRTIVDAILWGIRHIDEQDISHTSLQMLYDLLHSVSTSPQVGELFYHYFYMSIIQDVMQILTDRAHKSGFRLQCSLLAHLGRIVIENKIETPLEASDGTSAANSSNLEFIADHLSRLMLEAFTSSLTQSMISDFFADTVFNRDTLQSSDRFRQSVRDFLIDMCEFRLDGDSKEMWSHEINQRKEEEHEFDSNMTPGLVNPNSLPAGDEVYDDYNDDDDEL